MKKIFILALCVGTLSSAFAQSPYGRQQNRNDDYAYSSPNRGSTNARDYDRRDYRNDRRYNEQYSFTLRERDALLLRVNREYESRVNSIRYNRFMRNSEKRREMQKLEFQKAQDVRAICLRYDDNRNKYNDRYYDRNYNWRN